MWIFLGRVFLPALKGKVAAVRLTEGSEPERLERQTRKSNIQHKGEKAYLPSSPAVHRLITKNLCRIFLRQRFGLFVLFMVLQHLFKSRNIQGSEYQLDKNYYQ